jgi:hypothetical protein
MIPAHAPGPERVTGMSDERENLRLLAIFHYVLGGISTLMVLFPLIYVALGVAFLAAPDAFGGKPGNEPPEFLGIFMTAFGGIFAMIILSAAVCLIVAGRFLAQQKHYAFCVATAAVACLYFPLGTALGVFTLILLTKSETRALFEPKRPQAA